MTRFFKAVSFCALAMLGVSAIPALAQTQIDVPSLTCSSYGAMSAGDQILAVNAVRSYARDSANGATTGELQATISDHTDAELQARVAVSCKDKPADTTVFDLLLLN